MRLTIKLAVMALGFGLAACGAQQPAPEAALASADEAAPAGEAKAIRIGGYEVTKSGVAVSVPAGCADASDLKVEAASGASTLAKLQLTSSCDAGQEAYETKTFSREELGVSGGFVIVNPVTH